MNNTFIRKVTNAEYLALSEGFSSYLNSKHQRKLTTPERIKFTNDLASEFKSTFLENPAVRDKLNESKKTSDNFLFFNKNDVINLNQVRTYDEYRNNRYRIENLKARFMIFCLEIKGFYRRPPQDIANNLHYAIMKDLFIESSSLPAASDDSKQAHSVPNGYFEKKIIERLIGTYQLYRLTFNNSFPDHIAVHTLTIFSDADDPNVICYSTHNSYKQLQSSEKERGLQRIRDSYGHVYNYQGQLLFLGGTAYSHLDEVEPGENKSNYPEIMMMHSHGGDTKSIRGLILGHFPLLGLPVATSVYMSKLDNKTATHLDEVSKKEPREWSIEDRELMASHYGNIGSNNEQIEPPKNKSIEDQATHKGYLKLYNETKIIRKFVENQIESTYSKMLTP